MGVKASPARIEGDAYIDFSRMTASLVAVVTNVYRDGRRVRGPAGGGRVAPAAAGGRSRSPAGGIHGRRLAE